MWTRPPREGPCLGAGGSLGPHEDRDSGGNQRELARQKNMKKTQEISKGKRKEDSLTTSQRKQRDSEIMQQKQKAANEKKSMQTREK
ncbi:small EDRK-rich factor 1 isoform X1 [Callithrix jacchus]